MSIPMLSWIFFDHSKKVMNNKEQSAFYLYNGFSHFARRIWKTPSAKAEHGASDGDSTHLKYYFLKSTVGYKMFQDAWEIFDVLLDIKKLSTICLNG